METTGNNEPQRQFPNLRSFPKGVSGNPSGRPTGFEEVALQARKLGPAAIVTLGEILQNPKAKDMARLRAAELILERGFGKAPAFKTSDPEGFRDVLQLTDEQIRQRLAAIRVVLLEHGIDPLTLPAPNGNGVVRQGDAGSAQTDETNRERPG